MARGVTADVSQALAAGGGCVAKHATFHNGVSVKGRIVCDGQSLVKGLDVQDAVDLAGEVQQLRVILGRWDGPWWHGSLLLGLPGGGFLKIISVGNPTHAGMKTDFYADFSPRNRFSCRHRSECRRK